VRSQAIRRVSVAVAALLVAVLPAGAQEIDSAGPPGSELSVYLMTMGQGDQIWERYGHNAIGIRDRRANSDIVYNWGLFSFEEPGFIGRFLRGEMMYWMGPQDAASTLAQYRMLNRTVEVQELNLSPAQRVALYDFIRFNAREENKYYLYDYFLDNCSTRVRDALDGVLGGALRMATDSQVTGTTYRWHALRLMAEDRLTVVGIDIGLGRPTDRPITAWEEMFIPMKVRDRVRELRVPDDSGRLVPLVLSERVLFQAQRTPERETPPPLVIPLGLIGLLLGGGLAALARRQSRAALPVAAIVALVLGAIGVALLYLRFMTKHVAAYDNTNLFAYNPVWLVVAATLLFVGRFPAARRLVFVLATIAGALTAFGIIAPFFPGFTQGSFAAVALAAPAGLAAAWIVRERSRPAPAPAPAT
jgi:hypothetical protein